MCWFIWKDINKKNLVYYILKGYIEVKCVVNSTIVRKIVFLNTIIFCYGFLESMKTFSSIYSALTIATDIINSNYKFKDSIINFYYIPCRPWQMYVKCAINFDITDDWFELELVYVLTVW